ncbi:hypothetical protein SAMN06295974_2088 [Plantibacter flavus]|uniref:Uncharacterized protein n=1 Tax=Plantibacter flavus TaxID=150123 RepID=A0A3N2BZT0_9MICO|nr:hypothetical protein EDD42_0790 [Plantibacter flavus]SMG31550.1 hypothetical protein SAMN06295974_2088 [Plantibacter flavus]
MAGLLRCVGTGTRSPEPPPITEPVDVPTRRPSTSSGTGTCHLPRSLSLSKCPQNASRAESTIDRTTLRQAQGPDGMALRDRTVSPPPVTEPVEVPTRPLASRKHHRPDHPSTSSGTAGCHLPRSLSLSKCPRDASRAETTIDRTTLRQAQGPDGMAHRDRSVSPPPVTEPVEVPTRRLASRKHHRPDHPSTSSGTGRGGAQGPDGVRPQGPDGVRLRAPRCPCPGRPRSAPASAGSRAARRCRRSGRRRSRRQSTTHRH